MDLSLETEKFLLDLKEIEVANASILRQAYLTIELCQHVLYSFKSKVISKGFDSLDSEINFFKIIKQIPLIKLIYFSEIHSFEIQFPKGNKDSQLKYIKRKINKLNRFFLYNLDFGQYINSGLTHFDKEYYTRNYLDKYHITTSKFYFQDPDFSTPRDMLLGKYKAYNILVIYLDDRMSEIKTSKSGSFSNSRNTDKLPWPFTNTDFTELTYALWYAGFYRQKNLSIIQLAQKLEEIFDLKSTDIYKNFQEIKRRKNSRTIFLDQMATSLLYEINKSEG